jgi:hypothetical protein
MDYKFEIRSTKFETMIKILMFKTADFSHFDIVILNLFRISIFEVLLSSPLVKTGVQNPLNSLDTGFRRYDGIGNM